MDWTFVSTGPLYGLDLCINATFVWTEHLNRPIMVFCRLFFQVLLSFITVVSFFLLSQVMLFSLTYLSTFQCLSFLYSSNFFNKPNGVLLPVLSCFSVSPHFVRILFLSMNKIALCCPLIHVSLFLPVPLSFFFLQ